MHIAIAGLGGIGGYIGGKLAYHYSGSGNVKVSFICRGEQFNAIKANGLQLHTENQLLNCIPDKVCNDPGEIGKIDLLIVCTKTYGLENVLTAYASALNENSAVITVQNSVNAHEIILPLLPVNTSLFSGGIYISSNLTAPGIVHHVSGPSKLFFGTNGFTDANGYFIAELLNAAGIDSVYSSTINTLLWKKFMFVSPAAVVTSIGQITFSQILEKPESRELYTNLIGELLQLARIKNIETDPGTIENNCSLLGRFAPNVKSSLQIDLEKKNPTEIDSLIRHVISESGLYGIPVPHYSDALKTITSIYSLN